MHPAVEHKGTGPNQKGFQEKINEAENVHRVLIGLHNSPLRGRPGRLERPSPAGQKQSMVGQPETRAVLHLDRKADGGRWRGRSPAEPGPETIPRW